MTLRVISGHRDTGPSECPGNGAYALLPGIAKRVAATGLPKLYSPTVVGTLGGPMRFQARLSSSLAWTVTVTDAHGHAVAHGHGTGDLVDWTWHSPVGKASYTWSIEAPGVLAATGTIGAVVAAPQPPPRHPPRSRSLASLRRRPCLPRPTAPVRRPTSRCDQRRRACDSAACGRKRRGRACGAQRAARAAGANSFTLDVSAVPDGRYTLALSGAAGEGNGGDSDAADRRRPLNQRDRGFYPARDGFALVRARAARVGARRGPAEWDRAPDALRRDARHGLAHARLGRHRQRRKPPACRAIHDRVDGYRCARLPCRSRCRSRSLRRLSGNVQPRAPPPSNRQRPAARRATRLRTALGPDSRTARQGRRQAGPFSIV